MWVLKFNVIQQKIELENLNSKPMGGRRIVQVLKNKRLKMKRLKQKRQHIKNSIRDKAQIKNVKIYTNKLLIKINEKD